MTRLTVVSSFTSLQGAGSLELGDVDLRRMTVADVKRAIEARADGFEDGAELRLWWSGYVLDNGNAPMSEACIGVNPGERVEEKAESLVIFLTVHENEDSEDDWSHRSRLRSNSFDLDRVRNEIRRQGKNCIIM
mmetsp:Transcript_8235/g.17416  ORF Transcript_8235/g.17416 Transcript_8235/m.17416 type:complete len:134 (-) Transcript_8235:275-676(-)|eukprot:CAMPEP_0183315214 /NCGR_PEP_ID=MMETSP0160_2-20130417/50973_1 /TAXON_ID=2839 ORGANISM="Odontella Sinensis, Strain Grunow 1884" /NCGR_SAMPLE_ID=MMETSP0160_2 /ASSEMBLY_ACC=CAM_ASM_000250 /LENGTH=133 /DNA_ID=CAMNT_0025480725 /DNA_START=1 /DNA_END=402 /DNA_ORIENTATION=+